MFLSNEEKEREFQKHPQGAAQAVCVDVFTREVTKNGETKDKIVLVFETDAKMEPSDDGTVRNFAIWDWNNVPQSITNENGGLHKRLKQWGVEFSDGFDTFEAFEQAVLHRPASLMIVHNTAENGKVYDNIAACLPVEGGGGMAPTGAYTRQADRDKAPY